MLHDAQATSATEFLAPWWLRNPHLQTVWGRLARPRRIVRFRREVITTPDDDELIVDHVDPEGAVSDAAVILLHGLEGSSNSVYMQGLASELAKSGVRSVSLNFRFCARYPDNLSKCIPNRAPRLYHSGETGDFDFLLRTLQEREPQLRFAAIGSSLGGNVLLKWLGEHAGDHRLAAAATLSVPYDLSIGARHLERSWQGRLYTGRFLRTLNYKTSYVVERHPELRQRLDLARARRARTFFEFDDAANAPLHGFAGADDYYTRCSSIRFLDRIDVPTLCISAKDDPFLPHEVLDRAREVASSSVDFAIVDGGGHVGFVTGSTPWSCEYWGEKKAVSFILKELKIEKKSERESGFAPLSFGAEARR